MNDLSRQRAALLGTSAVTVLLLVVAAAGWALLPVEEVSGTVDDVGADYVVLNDMRFSVNGDTEFEEGYGSLSDVQTGDQAEVEYEARGNENVALGIEKGGDDGEEGDDDDDEGEDNGDY